MDATTRLAAALAHRLRLLRGTRESITVDLGDVFYQAASYEGNAVLIEITGDDFLPDIAAQPPPSTNTCSDSASPAPPVTCRTGGSVSKTTAASPPPPERSSRP